MLTSDELAKFAIGKAIEIHRTLGPGLLERVYSQCLEYSLRESGLSVEREKVLPVLWKDISIDSGYRVDLLVENKLVIEIKSVSALAEIHFAQTLTYLKLGKFNLGLLINFNVVFLKDGIRRIINIQKLNSQ